MKREKGKQYARSIRQYKKYVKYDQLEYKKEKKEWGRRNIGKINC